MSTSISEYARDAAKRAALLALVAERYPEARSEVIWDNGCAVPVLRRSERDVTEANRIDVRTVNGEECMLLYFLVGEDERGMGGLRVYVIPRYVTGPFCSTVLTWLSREEPEIYKALVEMVKTA